MSGPVGTEGDDPRVFPHTVRALTATCNHCRRTVPAATIDRSNDAEAALCETCADDEAWRYNYDDDGRRS